MILLDIPWAEIGTFLFGLGSVLSGYAAISAGRRAVKEAKNESHPENVNSGDSRIDDGGGSGVPGSDSSE